MDREDGYDREIVRRGVPLEVNGRRWGGRRGMIVQIERVTEGFFLGWCKKNAIVNGWSLNINKRVINEAGGLSRNDTRRARPRCYVLSAGLKKVAGCRGTAR